MMKLHPAEPADVGMSTARLDRIPALVQSWIEPGLHQAIVVLVARRGGVVLHEAFGSLTPEGPDATRDTIFPISSISKVITATAIMILVERGLVSLNAPAADFFPEFSGKDKNQVRLWHLLTHSIGGLRMEEMDAYLVAKKAAGFEPPPLPEGRDPLIHAYLCAGFDAPLTGAPGSAVGYSNYGYEMLGDIVRQVSGKPLADFAQENIFSPLGMKDTAFGLREWQEQRLVKRPPGAPYAVLADNWFCDGIEGETFRTKPWAMGGAFSTAMDMAIFCQMFLNRGGYGPARLLSPVTVAEMSRNQTPGFPDLDREGIPHDGSRGLGWDMPCRKMSFLYANLYSERTYKHSGAGGAMLWIDPLYELLGVFFSVELSLRSDLQRNWAADLFANAVTAAIEEV